MQFLTLRECKITNKIDKSTFLLEYFVNFEGTRFFRVLIAGIEVPRTVQQPEGGYVVMVLVLLVQFFYFFSYIAEQFCILAGFFGCRIGEVA